jgi:hypothetical protein
VASGEQIIVFWLWLAGPNRPRQAPRGIDFYRILTIFAFAPNENCVIANKANLQIPEW